MKINYIKNFLKRFHKLPPKVKEKFRERMNLFIKNVYSPVLRDHPLHGNLKNMRALSVSADIRVIYKYIAKDHIKLINIGTHNQVY